ARYIQKAEEELNCSTAEASRWAGAAANTLEQHRTFSDSDRDTAAMLRVRIVFLRNDIEVRQKALKQSASDVEKFIAAKRLSSAQRVIQRVMTNTPTCDARFRQWEFEVRQSLAQADRLVQSADQAVGQDPKQALHLYQSALAINIEQPGIASRMESARAASRNGHPVVKKVIWITVGMALAAGAAYEGE